ncbi:hypothetical protein AB28_1362 [Raoultella ornithinolytica 2-156-04_S1_C2]|nr:hypothetical protein AB00_1350 [Raoultella ornithinolytica 2-156-04_S1_C1]KDX15265.1 hypothetical protein AB28_1362 [Raoultella ornithinolytica 2-156-04_S1_C2]
MREVIISAPELQQVMPFLSVEHWGDGVIGGEIYRIPMEEE